MRTNIVLDDRLVEEAFGLAKEITTKKQLVDEALREFVRSRKLKDLRHLRGAIELAEGYDYRAMRG